MVSQLTLKLEKWLARLRRGDATVFNELFPYFEARLFALTRKMLGSFPDAHRVAETGDVFQNASLRFMRALKDFASGSAGEGGTMHAQDFFRLAALQIRRELLDLVKQYRRRSVRHVMINTDSSNSSGLSALAGQDSLAPDCLAEWAEFHTQVASLPTKVREVFHLVWYDGLTQAEAAAIIGVDVRTVKSRWQEARLLLYEKLDGRLPGGA